MIHVISMVSKRQKLIVSKVLLTDMFRSAFLRVLDILTYEYAKSRVRIVKKVIERIELLVSVLMRLGLLACSVYSQIIDVSIIIMAAQATATPKYRKNTRRWV